MSNEIKCPRDECQQKFKKNTKHTKSEIQHHLYMAHRLDAIESHKEAERVVAENA